MRPFDPLFRNPHLSTLAGNFWPRRWKESLYPTTARLYQTAPGTQVLVHENSPARDPVGEVLLLHGLEGSSAGGYMLSLARTLVDAGFRTHRLNLRGCGGTEHLTDTLYHSGLTHDARWLLEHLRSLGRGPLFIVGFSLGGNVTLKLAGELGPAARGLISGAVAVSTPIDLYACVQAMSRRENILYELRFITRLRSRYRLRHRSRPELFPIDRLRGASTVFEFDDRITAPHFGFGDALNYYSTQSSQRFIGAIEIPTLLIQAKDDPLIPFALFESPTIAAHPHVTLVATDHGGHLGYIARRRPRFWLDSVVSHWFAGLRNKEVGNLV